MTEGKRPEGSDDLQEGAAASDVIHRIRRMGISVAGADGTMTPVLSVLEAAWTNPASALFPNLDPSIQFEGGIMTIEEIERQEVIWLREIARCPRPEED